MNLVPNVPRLMIVKHYHQNLDFVTVWHQPHLLLLGHIWIHNVYCSPNWCIVGRKRDSNVMHDGRLRTKLCPLFFPNNIPLGNKTLNKYIDLHVRPASHLWLSHPSMSTCDGPMEGFCQEDGVAILLKMLLWNVTKRWVTSIILLWIWQMILAVTTLSHSKNGCDIIAYIMLGTVEMQVLFLVSRKYASEY